MTAEAVYVPIDQSAGVADLKTITVFPVGELPRGGETGGRPYVADGIGGRQVHLNSTDGTPQVAHEMGGIRPVPEASIVAIWRQTEAR